MKNIYIFIFTLASLNLTSQDFNIQGTVFEDRNGNGRMDDNEIGIASVVVSDQITSTVTDEDGAFMIESKSEFPYIFITQPSGYEGKYYYQKSSEVNFPIQKSKSQNHFKFIHASDTHIDSLNLSRMARFREMSDSIGVEFIIVSGDLVRDALRVNVETAGNYYRMYLSEIEKFSVPVYSGVGNHEIFGIERDKSLVSMEHPLYGKKMYRHYLGPNYYSFDYGGIHFLSLDGVDYQNLYYFGGVDSLQLVWLENDLKYVPAETPIVTFCHIPFVSPGFSFWDYDPHIFYGPSLLMQEGKLEHRHIVFNYLEVKNRIGNRPFPLALSGHYHAAQEGYYIGSDTKFAQTSAITRPDRYMSNGFEIRSGFTVYEVKDAKIISSQFIPLNLK